MFHHYDAVLNSKSGVPTADVIIRAFAVADDSIADLFADESGTPIESLSGIPNAAKSNADGNYDFFIADGFYNLRFYIGDALIQTIRNVQFKNSATVEDVEAKAQAAALGVTGAAENLGTGWSGIVPSNPTAKQALLALESDAETRASLVDLASYAASKGAGLSNWSHESDYDQGSLGDRMRYVLYANDFPFLAQPGTNATAAIQAAIAYAKTIAGDHGVQIRLRTGDYFCGPLLIDRSDITLRGDGDVRILRTTTTGNGIEFKAPTGTRIFRVGVKGIKFGNAYLDATEGAAVYFENCGTAFVDDIGYSRYPHKPYDVVLTYRCAGFAFRSVHGSESAGSGVRCVGTLDVKGSNSTLDVSDRHGLELDRCAGVHLTEVVNFGCVLHNIYVHADVPVEDVGDISDRSIFHYYVMCVGDTGGFDNWKIKDSRAIFGIQCWGSTHSTSTPDRVGFSFENTKDSKFTDTRARLCNGDGIYADANSSVKFVGGECISNGRIAGSTGKAGIRHQGVGCIKDFTFSNDAGLELQRYGIAVPLGDPANTMRIRDNTFVGMLDADFEPITSTNYTDFQVSGNSGQASATIASATSAGVMPTLDCRPVTVTGTADIYDFTPKWDGRSLNLRFSDAARVIHGSGMKLPSPNVVPGNYGRLLLEYSVSAAAWECVSLSVNDGA